MSRPLTIAVSGTGGEVADELLDLAREVGALLARDGVLVVTGGLDGIMAAAAQGTREAGGQVVGLLPGDRSDGGNEHLSVALATGLGQMRNALLVNAADGLISVGGSWGTLSEIALATRAGKPVVCLRGWTVTDADGRPLPLVVADTAAEAVTVLRNALS
ncbi:MAG: hypothetical protein QOJ37_2779 [Pseudonocardiales bacterium]|nr:hypothetical protein [Pseudonocardiales bacterium]